jgi:hypothetical protein
VNINNSGATSGELHIVAASGGANTFIRCGGGGLGGIEMVNNAYSAVPMFCRDTGAMSVLSLTQTCDYRMKRNVRTISPAAALARLMAVRPVDFDWIEGNRSSRGFLAHELAGPEPVAVEGEKDGMTTGPDGRRTIDPQRVNTVPLVADLVAAVQALTERLAVLEAQLGA